jgi:hypothetical protein
VPPGEENEDNDDDLAAQAGIGVSSEVKVKWRRSSVEGSHSDDSLWKLFSCYGQIESIELTGTKVGALSGANPCMHASYDVGCMGMRGNAETLMVRVLLSQGNSATIKFDKREAAEAAVKAYEVNDDMRVTIPADKRYKIFQKVFDPNAVSVPKPPGASLFGGAASSTVVPPAPQKYNTGMENDVLSRMREAAALRKQQQSQAAANQPNPQSEAQSSSV